jgi:site-specific DNA-methyltransferase (adenine-specific)
MEYNVIINGDALSTLQKIDSDSIDLVITSPPYYKQREYNSGVGEIGNEITQDEYLNSLLEVFCECVRILKPTGTIVYNLGDKYINGGLSLIPYRFAINVIDSGKCFLVNDLTWVKSNPTPRQDRKKLISSTEPFFIFAKTKNYKFKLDSFLQQDLPIKKVDKSKTNLGGKYFEMIYNSNLTDSEKINAKSDLEKTIELVKLGEISDFRMKIRGVHKLAYGGQKGGRNVQINNNGYSIIKMTGNKLKRDLIESSVSTNKDNSHPAVFPIYIIKELIKLLTDVDDVVLDPFVGSGTTCLASKELNRRYVGVELNSDYVNLANNRLS